jgi:hypothetical protein
MHRKRKASAELNGEPSGIASTLVSKRHLKVNSARKLTWLVDGCTLCSKSTSDYECTFVTPCGSFCKACNSDAKKQCPMCGTHVVLHDQVATTQQAFAVRAFKYLIGVRPLTDSEKKDLAVMSQECERDCKSTAESRAASNDESWKLACQRQATRSILETLANEKEVGLYDPNKALVEYVREDETLSLAVDIPSDRMKDLHHLLSVMSPGFTNPIERT